MTTQVQIYDRVGTARALQRSYSWVRLSFANGTLPTEAWINEKAPAITKPTLDRIARLMKRKLNS
jgi:hypothetical protein